MKLKTLLAILVAIIVIHGVFGHGAEAARCIAAHRQRRPMNLTAHGGGTLSFVAVKRFFSPNYGKTWPDSINQPQTKDGHTFHLEGNAWAPRDYMILALLVVWVVCGIIGGGLFAKKSNRDLTHGEVKISWLLGPVLILIAVLKRQE